jgi:uncharacterized membrane protein
MKSLFRYFVQGLIVVLPVTLTIVVVYKLFRWMLGIFSQADTLIHPYADPVIFLLLTVIIIILIGAFGTNLLARWVWGSIEKRIEKAPLIKIIYSSTKDFLSAFIGDKKRFNRPVLITTNVQTGAKEMGFITQDDLSEIGLDTSMIAVYIPASYAVSGRLLLIPKKYVEEVDVPAADAMKFIVSGGVSEID